jgi:hypothetical protein
MMHIDFEDVHDVTGWSTEDVDHLVLHKKTTWYETIPPFYENLILLITQLCIFTIILRYQSSTVKKTPFMLQLGLIPSTQAVMYRVIN